MAHTNTPWTVEETPDTYWIGVKRANSNKVGEVICGLDHGEYTDEYEARRSDDARLIVRAVNAFEPMREALEGLLARHRDGSDESHWAEWDAAEEALALADKDGTE